MSDNFVFQWSPSQGTTYSDNLSDVMAAERKKGSSVKGLAAPQRVEEEVEEAEPSWREQFSSMLSAYWGDDEAAKGTFTSPDQPMYDPEMEVYDEYAKAGERTTFDSSPTPDALKSADREAAPTIDTRSNEALDKPPADAPDAETPMPSPPEVKKEGLMADPRGFKVPEYKVYNSPDEMSELEILARTIEAEAALESYKGKIAVGATIANRASSSSYGKDIRGVILKPAQFSPWNKYTGAAKGKQGKDMMKLRASEDSYKAANDILTGNYDDPTNGATHYVNESIAEGQKWIDVMKGRKKGTVTIGNHLFGNADNNKKYDGKSYIFDRKSETTDQPVEAAPITVKTIQRIIGTVADGDFGPASRKKAREFLNSKGIDVAKSATDEDLMKLVVSS